MSADEPIHEISGMPAMSGVIPSANNNTLEYIVVRNTFDVETQAYFAYSLEEACARKDNCEKETGVGWRIAVVLK